MATWFIRGSWNNLENNMALTIREKTGDGVTTTIDVDFDLGYLRQEFVYVYLDGNSYTNQLSYQWINSSQIELDAPVQSGQVFYVRRVIPRNEPVNDYEDGAILKEKNLDDSFVQTLMILEEIKDGFIQVEGEFTIGTDMSIDGELDMNDNRIKNVANAIESGDAINWQQAVDLLAQGGTPVTTVTEEIVLASGQVDVNTSLVDATKAVFYIAGKQTDNGRLTINDITVNNATSVTLAESRPEGSILVAVFNEAEYGG